MRELSHRDLFKVTKLVSDETDINVGSLVPETVLLNIIRESVLVCVITKVQSTLEKKKSLNLNLHSDASRHSLFTYLCQVSCSNSLLV